MSEYWHAGSFPCMICGAEIDHVHPDATDIRYIAPQSAYTASRPANPLPSGEIPVDPQDYTLPGCSLHGVYNEGETCKKCPTPTQDSGDDREIQSMVDRSVGQIKEGRHPQLVAKQLKAAIQSYANAARIEGALFALDNETLWQYQRKCNMGEASKANKRWLLELLQNNVARYKRKLIQCRLDAMAQLHKEEDSKS